MMNRPMPEPNAPTTRPATLRKPGHLILTRAECSSNLWGYLCDRYGVNPSATTLLMLTPPQTAEAHQKGATHS